jgi:hypothetical protein
MPESELEEFEKLRKLRDRSRVSGKKWLSEIVSDVLLIYFKRDKTCLSCGLHEETEVCTEIISHSD